MLQHFIKLLPVDDARLGTRRRARNIVPLRIVSTLIMIFVPMTIWWRRIYFIAS